MPKNEDDEQAIITALTELHDSVRALPSGIGDRLQRHLRAIQVAADDPASEDRPQAIHHLERLQDAFEAYRVSERLPEGEVTAASDRLLGLLQKRENDARARDRRVKARFSWAGLGLAVLTAIVVVLTFFGLTPANHEQGPAPGQPAQVAPPAPAPGILPALPPSLPTVAPPSR